MESRGEKLGKFHKRGNIGTVRIRRVCIADRSVSDSQESKDDTLGIAGHRIGNVGKCHLYGAYILSYN